MLQINANPNQDGFIVLSYEYQGKCHIELLSSNKIYKFEFSTNYGKILESRILVVSNGLVLVKHFIDSKFHQFLVHNPITRQCIELPQLSLELFIDWKRNCDFLNMICNLAHIRYLWLPIPGFTFIVHPLVNRKQLIHFPTSN